MVDIDCLSISSFYLDVPVHTCLCEFSFIVGSVVHTHVHMHFCSVITHVHLSGRLANLCGDNFRLGILRHLSSQILLNLHHQLLPFYTTFIDLDLGRGS